MAGFKNLDWYEDQLDRDDLSEATRLEYEAIANRLASQITKAQETKREKVEADKRRAEEIKMKLLAGDLDIVETVGFPEFGSDYEILEEGNDFVVYSKVSRDDQDNRWILTTREDADAKYRQLIYYRLYDRYVRPGDVLNIKDLVS